MLKGKPTASTGSVFLAVWNRVAEEDNVRVLINQWEVMLLSVITSAIKSVILTHPFPYPDV